MKKRALAGAICASLILSACATPVKLAGKAAWFAVKLGAGLAWNVATGIGKIGTKETVNALDLTASAAIRLMAQKESDALVQAFWNLLMGNKLSTAYDLLSKGLKRDMQEREFNEYVQRWSSALSAFQTLDSTVRQFHVETPTKLTVRSSEAESEVLVKVYVSKLKEGWRITGWEAESEKK